MAGLILSIAILLGVYCFVCRDKHDEKTKNHEKAEQVESEENKEDLFKNPRGISGY